MVDRDLLLFVILYVVGIARTFLGEMKNGAFAIAGKTLSNAFLTIFTLPFGGVLRLRDLSNALNLIALLVILISTGEMEILLAMTTTLRIDLWLILETQST